MNNRLAKSILRVCEALNQHAVEYLIVGGTAVALHGYFRMSTRPSGEVADKPDLDFWYNPTYANYFKLLTALAALGQEVTKYKKDRAPNPGKSFFKYEFEQFTLDFLPIIKAPIPFNAAAKRKVTASLHGVEIFFIGYEDLLVDKQTNARGKDLDDIEQLSRKRGLDGG